MLRPEFTLIGALLTVALFGGMLAFMEAGRRMGVRHFRLRGKEALTNPGTVEGAVFNLLALLIAFTLSGAMARFDARRQMIAQEANAIGTAYKRLDLLPHEFQPPLRELFRQYLDSRLATYNKVPNLPAARNELERSARLQDQIWQQALTGSQKSTQLSTVMMVLPAIDQMCDIATLRTNMSQIHPPAVIFVMLYVLALAASLVAGYSMAQDPRHNWIRFIGFPFMIAITVFVIMDLEYPRIGLIRIHAFDQVLIDLRQNMK